jgi:hypothetical protein
MWEPTTCLVCHAVWDGPPEWDRSRIMRRLWFIEWRWRDGFALGPWHTAEVVPGTATSVDVQEIMSGFQDTEVRRQARSKGAFRFEYRAVSVDMEVYQKDAVA